VCIACWIASCAVFIQRAMHTLYKTSHDAIRRAIVSGPLVMIFLLTYPPKPVFCCRVPIRSSVVPVLRLWAFYIATPIPRKISLHITLCWTFNFISVSFCTVYIIVTFRATGRVTVSFRLLRVKLRVRVWDR